MNGLKITGVIYDYGGVKKIQTIKTKRPKEKKPSVFECNNIILPIDYVLLDNGNGKKRKPENHENQEEKPPACTADASASRKHGRTPPTKCAT